MDLKKFRLRRDDFLLHLSSVTLALFIFYSVVFTANLLRMPFYVGYKKYIINITVLSVEADKILWAISIALFSVITFLRGSRGGFKSLKSAINRDLLVLSLFYGMLVLAAIETASFACWIYNLFYPSLPFSGENWRFAFTEVQLTNILYPALPILVMFFAYSWVGEFTFKGLLARRESNRNEEADHDAPYFKSPIISIVIVAFSFVAALFVAYYNYAIAGVGNPGFPGVDVHLHYTKYLREVSGMSFLDALRHAAENDRFLHLVFEYLLFLILDDFMDIDTFVTYFMPFVLTVLLMLSTFMLVKVKKSSFHAATAMLITVFSFQVTVGLFAAFFANWFALSFVYISYALLIMVLEGKSKSSFMKILLGLSTVTVLFTHPWTWILLIMMVLSAYVVTTLILVYVRKKDVGIGELKFLLILLAFNLLMFYIRGSLHIGSGVGFVEMERFRLSLLNIFRLKIFLDRTFNWYVGGFYGFPPAIILAVLGVLSILDYEDRYYRLLLNWILVASAMILVDFPWQPRFLYDTPFNIYISLGILYCSRWIYRFELKDQRFMTKLIFWVFYVLLILLFLNYVARCVVIKQFGSYGLTKTP